jgi:hypothetical protein
MAQEEPQTSTAEVCATLGNFLRIGTLEAFDYNGCRSQWLSLQDNCGLLKRGSRAVLPRNARIGW